MINPAERNEKNQAEFRNKNFDFMEMLCDSMGYCLDIHGDKGYKLTSYAVDMEGNANVLYLKDRNELAKRIDKLVENTIWDFDTEG